jgi:hypothetical protein
MRRTHQCSPRRHYRGVRPIDWRHDHLVELDDRSPQVGPDRGQPNLTEWKARPHLGCANDYTSHKVPSSAAQTLLRCLLHIPIFEVAPRSIASLLQPLFLSALNGLPNAESPHDCRSTKSKVGMTPDDICNQVVRADEQSFPSKEWKGKTLTIEVSEPPLRSLRHSGDGRAGGWQPLPLGTRLAAPTSGHALLCDRLKYTPEEAERLLVAVWGKGTPLFAYLGRSEPSVLVAQPVKIVVRT